MRKRVRRCIDHLKTDLPNFRSRRAYSLSRDHAGDGHNQFACDLPARNDRITVTKTLGESSLH